MPKPIQSESEIKPGDFYEDTSFHPCLCTSVQDGCALGISLIDGSEPRMADLYASDVALLTLEEVIEWKRRGPLSIRAEWLAMSDQKVADGWTDPSENID